MAHFEIKPVLASAIPEAAEFLHKQKQDADDSGKSPFPKPVADDPVGIKRRLRWLLLENPHVTDGSPLGFCIRDDSGAIRGLLLCFPGRFVFGERRLLGLASGGFFVEPQAQAMGFYLFKKELGLKGYSFFFSNTCNGNSARLWEALGGCAIPNFDLEYVLPLKLDTLFPALLAGKTSNRVALAIAELLGTCGNRIMPLFRHQSTGLTIEPCRDWQKLSELFHRHRSNDSITTDRSPQFLEWRYGQNSDAYPSGVYLFRDRRGNEGWFSLGNARRGRWGQISGSVLLDAIWPRERIGFSEILPGIIDLVAGKFDVLALAPRPELHPGEFRPWMFRRQWVAPVGFVIGSNCNSRTIAAALDLSWADGDTALPISPSLRSEAKAQNVCSAAPSHTAHNLPPA